MALGGRGLPRRLERGHAIYLARVLGAERFGIYGFALAVIGHLTAVVDGGFTLLGTRDVARAG